MTLQPDAGAGAPQSYALERLRQLQGLTVQQMTGMVVQRARVEKYRAADQTAAWGAYQELERTRKELAASLCSLQYLLLEVEAYKLAGTAEQLYTGVSGFNLMLNNYKGVYDAVCGFAQKLPVGEKASATVLGRLMNSLSMGYYPTDPENISLILRGIKFPEGVTTNLLDPCCGCGMALRQMAQGNNCFAYGVELDEHRAEEAQTRLHRVGFGSYFYSRISNEAFHLLFLNPPYLSVLKEGGGRTRDERRFLAESLYQLIYGGLLIYIIPFYRLTPDICRILCDNFEKLSVWRFTDREFKRFRQIAVLGLRKRRSWESPDTAWLEHYAVHPEALPTLDQIEEGRYPLPAEAKMVEVFKGEKFNEKELEQQLRRSDSFTRLFAGKELDGGGKRPLLPLSIGQVGLIGGSGLINGLIECECPHIIKGRIVKEKRIETEEQFSERGRHMATEVREVITNKMIFNILTPNGFKSLT